MIRTLLINTMTIPFILYISIVRFFTGNTEYAAMSSILGVVFLDKLTEWEYIDSNYLKHTSGIKFVFTKDRFRGWCIDQPFLNYDIKNLEHNKLTSAMFKIILGLRLEKIILKLLKKKESNRIIILSTILKNKTIHTCNTRDYDNFKISSFNEWIEEQQIDKTLYNTDFASRSYSSSYGTVYFFNDDLFVEFKLKFA